MTNERSNVSIYKAKLKTEQKPPSNFVKPSAQKYHFINTVKKHYFLVIHQAFVFENYCFCCLKTSNWSLSINIQIKIDLSTLKVFISFS